MVLPYKNPGSEVLTRTQQFECLQIKLETLFYLAGGHKLE